MQDQYIQILEKTNQQLSLWSNPYGVMVASLAILFTVLAIVATIVIYRQSKGYKEQLQADRDQYAKSINNFLDSQKIIIEERKKEVEKVEKEINELLTAYKKDLEKSSKTQKAEIEKAILKLEQEKISLKSTLGASNISPDYTRWIKPQDNNVIFSNDTYHKCSKCGYDFSIGDNTNNIHVARYPKIISCPKCGNNDISFY